MKVELIDSLGDDLAIVNAARVSYAKQSSWLYSCPKCGFDLDDDNLTEAGCVVCKTEWAGYTTPTPRLTPADAGLINYLMKNRHGTPFEMVVFKFRVKVPIGVAREWQRHRIGSFNEVSTRYVEMQPDFYEPPRSAWREQVGKPGHYHMVSVEDDERAETLAITMHRAYEAAYGYYQDLIAYGVAKELARNVLPLGLMTEFIWAVNLRSLFNFLSLRTHETALLEIREPAKVIEGLVEAKVPVAMKAWNDNGRAAP